MVPRGNMSSILSSNFEAFSSELLDNLDGMSLLLLLFSTSWTHDNMDAVVTVSRTQRIEKIADYLFSWKYRNLTQVNSGIAKNRVVSLVLKYQSEPFFNKEKLNIDKKSTHFSNLNVRKS